MHRGEEALIVWFHSPDQLAVEGLELLPNDGLMAAEVSGDGCNWNTTRAKMGQMKT